MVRTSPRVSLKVEALAMAADGQEHPVRLVDLGLAGARLEPVQSVPGKKKDQNYHRLCLSLPGLGDLDIGIETVWDDSKKKGVRFCGASRGDFLKIWHHIRESLHTTSFCHYCGSDSVKEKKCRACGWSSNYDDPGYFSYWEKESRLRTLAEMASRMDAEALEKAINLLHETIGHGGRQPAMEVVEEFVGSSESMKQVFGLIRRVATTDLPVLILGESGTGKEMAARAIHERSSRSKGPFVPINCASIPEQLMEAELFGYEKGAFTGAYQAKKGKLELAHGGTVFLDEVGELPPGLQPKLLRFLEDGGVERVGSLSSRQVDVRLIAATNKDLELLEKEKLFRTDLYYRLRVFVVKMPPLRERGEDVIVLANYFLKKVKMERAWKCKGFSKEALEAMRLYHWPGNVRELFNRIRRAVAVQDEWIRPEDMELAWPDPPKAGSKLRSLSWLAKKQILQKAIKDNQLNMARTARALGISRSYLYTLLKRFELNREFS
ncbi:MAG: sigma-54 dependent transcriptional regulator [bacterium]